jgi:Sulfotransferase domain
MPPRKRVLLLGRRGPADLAPRWLRSARTAGYISVRRLTRHSYDGGIVRPQPIPACPPGWRTGPPDFVGVGVQRCGTTRWIRLIASHPEVVWPPSAKELHYFDRFYVGGWTERDIDGYHKYFPRDGERKVGEWTPLYMSAPWVPALLAQAAPRARLLVLLRDPIERYLSGLQHDTGAAREQGVSLSRLAPLDAFVRGLYHAQLTGLLAHFDRSQVLVLQYERCAKEPLAELRKTFSFLGLREVEFVPDLTIAPNRQPSKPKLDARAQEAYVRAYHDDVTALAEAFPEIDLALWPNFAHLAG